MCTGHNTQADNINGFLDSHSDYLFYALLDVTIDNYFAVVEMFGDSMDGLEEEIRADAAPAVATAAAPVREAALLRLEEASALFALDADPVGQSETADDEDEPATAREVVARVGAVLRNRPDTPILVKADRAVPYGNVVGAMVLLQQGGAGTVGFVTDPLDTYPVPE